MANSLKDRILKNSKIDATSLLTESEVFSEQDSIVTSVKSINTALSGSTKGGLLPGILLLAGPSKHFKTSFPLVMASAFQKKYPEGVILFYDSEFGSPEEYFLKFGIDVSRVIHTPITNIEELKFDLMNQLENFKKGDEVMIVIDSLGNLASKKEVEDALKENSAADMTRAKQFKSLFRMITPHLKLKHIPLVGIAHTYETQEMFSKQVVSGGTGQYYSANDIWIIGRQQEKTGTEVTGYNFIINIEKSRTVKEKSKIPVSVSYDSGIKPLSGMFDLALELGFIAASKQGWYQEVDQETGELIGQNRRKGDMESDEDLFNRLLENGLEEAIQKKFKLVL